MNTLRIMAGLALAGLAQAAAAQETNRHWAVHLYGYAEHFRWQETMDGAELLEESGPLLGAGGLLALRAAPRLWIEAGGEVFAGQTEYDGTLQSRDGSVPYDSETAYSGVEARGVLVLHRKVGEGLRLQPYAGGGLRVWERVLDTQWDDRNIGTYGYTESWGVLYAALGVRSRLALGPRLELFGRAELDLPLYNRVTADLSNVGGPDDVEMEPGRRPAYALEGGLSRGRWSGSVFYATLDFGESPRDEEYGLALQPESEARRLGLKVQAAF